MRSINWRQFKDSEVVHIFEIYSLELYAYDGGGKLFDVLFHRELPAVLWAVVSVLGTYRRMSFGFTADGYVLGWVGKRMSSLPEHEYYFRDLLWLTSGDRDVLYGALVRGMLGVDVCPGVCLE